MKTIQLLPLAALALSLAACNEDDVSVHPNSSSPSSSIPLQEWRKIESKKIFWGHQSVGFNILEGMAELALAAPEISLRIVDATDPSVFEGAGVLAHAALGHNTDPRSKIDAFVEAIEGGVGNAADLAFMKFCYLDFQPGSDPRAIFADYKRALDRLAVGYPDTTFVHLTVPLTQRQTGPKALIKGLIGRPVRGREDNLRRYQFNSLLKSEYSAKAPIFDLAEIESTRPDGSREFVQVGDATIPALVPAYTHDGGHLNQLGRRKVATSLLLFLAGVD